MSNRYKGGIISATPPTTTGGDDGVASGAWTLEQQMQAQAAGLWPSQPVFYIEDVFSTWLYNGNGVSNADFVINNGIDLQNKGGLVWIKRRDATENYALTHTGQTLNANGFYPYLQQGAGAITANDAYGINAFTTTGLTLRGRSGPTANEFNSVGSSMASWTFRKQPKFFDVVTWTGDGATYRDITTGFSNCGTIIAKCTSATGDWWTWHRTFGSDTYLKLNTTAASSSADSPLFGSETGGTFGVAIQGSNSLNTNGATYVAYLFAHNAGGFGASGNDNVISCGSFATDGSGNATIDLGYEPQWVLMKASSGTGSWFITDNMRGMSYSGGNYLLTNTNAAEVAGSAYLRPTATGFGTFGFGPGSLTYIYIAIRRGPMAVPTTGTSVFAPLALSNSTGTTNTTGFPVDLQFSVDRLDTNHNTFLNDRLRGVVTSPVVQAARFLTSNTTNAESTGINGLTRYWDNTGFQTGSWQNNSATAYWNFRRAPGFFDEVCYTGNDANNRLIAHNLASSPELVIIKNRTGNGTGAPDGFGNAWWVQTQFTTTGFLASRLQVTNAGFTENYSTSLLLTAAPTNTNITLGNYPGVNALGFNYVAYLFASCPGVSKVGSYTGTGTTQTINCGFTGGARFVLIKRTDDTGDWYVWDSARGIVAGNDPYLLLNSTAAEVTNTDYIDTAATGFEISSTAPAAINASGGTFIFLAIA